MTISSDVVVIGRAVFGSVMAAMMVLVLMATVGEDVAAVVVLIRATRFIGGDRSIDVLGLQRGGAVILPGTSSRCGVLRRGSESDICAKEGVDTKRQMKQKV